MSVKKTVTVRHFTQVFFICLCLNFRAKAVDFRSEVNISHVYKGRTFGNIYSYSRNIAHTHTGNTVRKNHNLRALEKSGLSFCFLLNLAAHSPSALPSAELSAACSEVNSFMIPLSVLPIFKWLILPLWQQLVCPVAQLCLPLFRVIIKAMIRTAIFACYRTCDITPE